MGASMKILLDNSVWVTMTALEPRVEPASFASEGNAPYEDLTSALLALEPTGSTHWITYGTLLGLVRDGVLLRHDDDIDIAMVAGPDPERIAAAMIEHGFRYFENSTSSRGVVNQKFLAPRGSHVDISYLFPWGTDSLVEDYNVVGHSAARSIHPYLGVRTMTFHGVGVPVPVPSDPETYLAAQYGPGWRTPVTSWDWIFSPPNIVLHLRVADIPIFIAQWGMYRSRNLRRALRDLFAGAGARTQPRAKG